MDGGSFACVRSGISRLPTCRIQDSTAARIPGAVVSLTQSKLGVTRTAKTDTRGETRFEALQPGMYTVAVTAAGFTEKTSSVIVTVGSQPTLAITLGPETIQETVQVHDRGPSLATQPIEATSTIKTVITSADLDEIPPSARSFANISLLAPFTAPVEPSDPTKARIIAVSFGGSSGLNLDLSVDGGDNNDDYIGGFLQNYSPEAIQEFVVRTAQFSADTSRTNGGSIVLSTRRGSDDWHGGLSYYYLRGAPFYQVDLRGSRNIVLRERFTLRRLRGILQSLQSPEFGQQFRSRHFRASHARE